MSADKKIIFTIGHSDHSTKDFIRLLSVHGVKKLIDIRTVPKSRHNPQFNQSRLKAALQRNKISYVYMKNLGGWRHAKKDSINTGWKNLSFRGYADYMHTPQFAKSLVSLEKKAATRPAAIMCAEAVPWRCHRSLVSDALKRDKWEVRHITGLGKAPKHRYTSFMKIKKGQIYYPSK